MSSSFGEQIIGAMAAFRAQRDQLEAMRKELDAATSSATSKDRMVTAKVGSHGEVVSLTFHSDDYRTMARAELATVLVDVLNEARADMGQKVIDKMRSVQGVGDTLAFASMDGDTDVEKALNPLIAMRPKPLQQTVRESVHKQQEYTAPEHDKAKSSKKQEQFTDEDPKAKSSGKQEEFTGADDERKPGGVRG